MKIRSLVLLAMSTTLALASLAAGDDAEPAHYCHSPIADGGYAVKVWLDDAAGTARVAVGADSFVGVRKWTTYAASVTSSGRETLFQGDGLTLRMSGDRANLTATEGGAAVQGVLTCRSRQP